MWSIYTMACYSAIKRNKFQSVVGRQMTLELVTRSEVRKRETNIMH